MCVRKTLKLVFPPLGKSEIDLRLCKHEMFPENVACPFVVSPRGTHAFTLGHNVLLRRGIIRSRGDCELYIGVPRKELVLGIILYLIAFDFSVRFPAFFHLHSEVKLSSPNGLYPYSTAVVILFRAAAVLS